MVIQRSKQNICVITTYCWMFAVSWFNHCGFVSLIIDFKSLKQIKTDFNTRHFIESKKSNSQSREYSKENCQKQISFLLWPKLSNVKTYCLIQIFLCIYIFQNYILKYIKFISKYSWIKFGKHTCLNLKKEQ